MIDSDSVSQLLGHLDGLGFGEQPDYDLCLRSFDGAIAPGEEDLAALPPEAFDWAGQGGDDGGKDGGGDGNEEDGSPSAAAAAASASSAPAVSGYQRAQQEEAGMDAGARQLLLSKQVMALCAGQPEGEGGSPPSAPPGSSSSSSLSSSAKRAKGDRNSVGFLLKGGAAAAAGAGAGEAMPAIDLARMWARVGKRLVEEDEVRFGAGLTESTDWGQID